MLYQLETHSSDSALQCLGSDFWKCSWFCINMTKRLHCALSWPLVIVDRRMIAMVTEELNLMCS